jgi:hypothetical protein
MPAMMIAATTIHRTSSDPDNTTRSSSMDEASEWKDFLRQTRKKVNLIAL